MRTPHHPPIDEVTVEGVLHALSDPDRVAIFTRIAGSRRALACSDVLRSPRRAIPKSTLSQHFKVLREAGLIRSERRGVEMRNRSRCDEIARRFPGLIPAILRALRAEASARPPRP